MAEPSFGTPDALLAACFRFVPISALGALADAVQGAAADGLLVGNLYRSRWLSWDEVLWYEERWGTATAFTRSLCLSFSSRGDAGRRLAAALDQLLSRRRKGLALPRLMAAGEAALSPVTVGGEPDRGLSRGGPGDG